MRLIENEFVVNDFEKKQEKVLMFIKQKGIACSRYSIEKAIKCSWKETEFIVREMTKSGKLKEIKTTSGEFYDLNL